MDLLDQGETKDLLETKEKMVPLGVMEHLVMTEMMVLVAQGDLVDRKD